MRVTGRLGNAQSPAEAERAGMEGKDISEGRSVGLGIGKVVFITPLSSSLEVLSQVVLLVRLD